MERFKKLLRLYPDATLRGRMRHTLLCKDVRAIRDELSLSCPGLKHINLSQNEVRCLSVSTFRATESTTCLFVDA